MNAGRDSLIQALYVNVPSQDHVMQLWEVRDEREPWSGQ